VICPSCGFEQPAGENCSQCQTPLGSAFKESPLTETSVEPKQPSPSSVSGKAVAEPSNEVKRAPPKPETIPEPSRQAKKEKETQTPAPEAEKPAPTKKGAIQSGIQERLEQLDRVIVTTTSQLEGKLILAYHGVVAATVLVKGDLLKEHLENAKGEVISMRSFSLEGAFEKARTVALTDLKVEAAKRGANAVVGLTMGQTPGIEGIWLYLVGTAVTLKE
jgi:uncharacterized protein YbjQ (UPF0145 family)